MLDCVDLYIAAWSQSLPGDHASIFLCFMLWFIWMFKITRNISVSLFSTIFLRWKIIWRCNLSNLKFQFFCDFMSFSCNAIMGKLFIGKMVKIILKIEVCPQNCNLFVKCEFVITKQNALLQLDKICKSQIPIKSRLIYMKSEKCFRL